MNRWLSGSTPLLLLLLVSSPLCASRISDQEVSVTFAADGSVLQTTVLRAFVADDPIPWSPPSIVLRDHETLEGFSANAVGVDRVARSVRAVRHRSSSSIVEGTHHSALTTHWFELPALRHAATVSFSYSVRSTPLFPEGSVEIPLDDPCRSARVEVVDPPPGFRYRLNGGSGVGGGEVGGGIVVTRPSQCEAGVAHGQRPPLVLHFAWGEADSWGELGRLYTELLEQPPGGEIERQARTVLVGIEEADDKIDFVLDFVKREIRYAAVERGEGWYVPDSPSTVLARGWGDCKDKALLLVRLFEAAGIDAHAALVDWGPVDALDPVFPRLSAFNHVIVAVAEPSLHGDSDSRWTFLDPTLPASDERVLHPMLEGRYALVLRDDGRSSLEQVRGRRRSNDADPLSDHVRAELRR
jgi:hypothetical protein